MPPYVPASERGGGLAVAASTAHAIAVWPVLPRSRPKRSIRPRYNSSRPGRWNRQYRDVLDAKMVPVVERAAQLRMPTSTRGSASTALVAAKPHISPIETRTVQRIKNPPLQHQ